MNPNLFCPTASRPLLVIIMAILFLAQVAATLILPEQMHGTNELTFAILEHASVMVLLSVPFVWWLFVKSTQADKRVRESEEKYRAMMSDAVDAIAMADTEGNLQEANKKMEALTGYTKNELLNMKSSQLHPQGELERNIALFKKLHRMVLWVFLSHIFFPRKNNVHNYLVRQKNTITSFGISFFVP